MAVISTSCGTRPPRRADMAAHPTTAGPARSRSIADTAVWPPERASEGQPGDGEADDRDDEHRRQDGVGDARPAEPRRKEHPAAPWRVVLDAQRL